MQRRGERTHGEGAPPPFGEAHALGTDPPGTRRDTRTGIVPERLRDGMAQVCRVTLTDEVRRSRDNGCASRHPPRGMIPHHPRWDIGCRGEEHHPRQMLGGTRGHEAQMGTVRDFSLIRS